MMSLMIVEDEQNIREGLVSLLDWEKEGFNQPVLFGGALEALHYLETERVDVIITDIYMPVLNGLEFIKIIREENRLCSIIILTGHERFEVAQEAVELGVKRYLLKPVSAEKLRQVLAGIRQDIAERMKLMDWITIAEKQLEENLPVMKNQFWNDLLSERFSDQQEIEARGRKAAVRLPEKEIICIAVRYLGSGSSLIQEVALRKIVDEILGEALVYLLSYDGVELVISEGYLPQFKLEILKESIQQNLGLLVCFGVSTVGSALGRLSHLAKEAVEAAKSIRDPKEMYYLYYADIARGRGKELEYPYILEKKILDMLRFHDSLDEDLIVDFLGQIMPPKHTVEQAKLILFQFLVAVNRTANDMGIQIMEEFREMENCIQRFEEIDEKLKGLVENAIRRKSNSTKRYAEVIVQQIEEIVNREFADTDLSVGSLAERLGLTANYLSRIYRSLTEETCIEYITKTRMNAAKSMLEHTDKKSYVIAQETGYNNANYFSALFKKHTGMSPKEYREREKRET